VTTSTEQIGSIFAIFLIIFIIYHRSSRRIGVFPKGDRSASKDYVSVYFYLLKDHPSYASYEISIVDESGNLKDTFSKGRLFAKTGYGWGRSKFISREKLFNLENGLIKNNTLTLTGKVEVPSKNSKFWLTNLKISESDELNNIFTKRLFTDLEVKVQEKSINVHKILLIASSSVLAEKLRDNQNVLELDDMEFEVAEELINFIYDGKVKDMEKYAKSLLEAADMFGIKPLKIYCENYLLENLTVDNAIETLKCSAKCNTGMLKIECADFIVQ
jgi:speckle-type POZ protein